MKTRLGPDHPDVLLVMGSIANILFKLGRGAEAFQITEDFLQLSPGKDVDRRMLPRVMNIRLRHFENMKDATGCKKTAEMWEKLNLTDADNLYRACCFRAVTAAVIKLTPSADEARLTMEQADQAMAWLKKAIAAGYKDADRIAKDKDLDALRDRDDFKKLMAEVQASKKSPKK
jgi:hypothetical protein